jgi:hypothetical protein
VLLTLRVPSIAMSSSTATAEMHNCANCHEDKGKDEFFKKQWNLKDRGFCKPCWGSGGIDNTSAVEGANKGVVVECICVTCNSTFSFLKKKNSKPILSNQCGDCIEKSQLKNTVESTCITCQGIFSFLKKNIKQFKSPKECTACVNETLRRQEEKEEESRKQRLLAEKTDYFMTYGVGYKFDVDEDMTFRVLYRMRHLLATTNLSFTRAIKTAMKKIFIEQRVDKWSSL